MDGIVNIKKIFNYVPSIVNKLIINSSIKDKDIFGHYKIKDIENDSIENKRANTDSKMRASGSSINNNKFPIIFPLYLTVIMKIKLRGFQKLIAALVTNDNKNQKEKFIIEYLSIVLKEISKIISEIITNAGGEVIKYNDYEFLCVWNYSSALNNNNVKLYHKYFSKNAIISSIDIMNKLDNLEISENIKLEVSIGIAKGDCFVVLFNTGTKTCEYLFLGKSVDRAEQCLDNSFPHEIIIGKEINDLFENSGEIFTKQIPINNGKKSLFRLDEYHDEIKSFKWFRSIRVSKKALKMNKDLHENLENKILIISSILPINLVNTLNVGIEKNLSEISMLTVATIHVFLKRKTINDFQKLQAIINNIMKCIHLTFGTLISITKLSSGLLFRCTWGIDPASFIDDTARAIASSINIGQLAKHNKAKIGIGITTGANFLGYINIQEDRRQLVLLGKNVHLSRNLADYAFQQILNNSFEENYLIYCDKLTMLQSQKFYRYIFINQMDNIINKDNLDELEDENDEFFCGFNKNKNLRKIDRKFAIKKKSIKVKKNKNILHKINKFVKKFSDKLSSDSDENDKYIFKYKLKDIACDKNFIKKFILSIEVYSPIEQEEYFIPNDYDPFPLLRTHLFNSYDPKNKAYLLEHMKNNIYLNKVNMNKTSLERLMLLIQGNQKDLLDKLHNSLTIFGCSKELESSLNLMNSIIKQEQRQYILIKGPLGIGKSLFIRKLLNDFLGKNEQLKKMHFKDSEQFIFFNNINPLSSCLFYNTVGFILRKIFLYLKKCNLYKEIFNIAQKLKFNEKDYKNTSIILSFGKNDIELENEYKGYINDNEINRLGIDKNDGTINKIKAFFYEMIILYKKYLNIKCNDYNINKIPLIFIIEDIQKSDQFSLDFIQYLSVRNDKFLNPFIIVLTEQTPFINEYYPPGKNIHFPYKFKEKNEDEKILCIDLKSINDKELLHKLIIFYNNQKLLEYANDKLLDFLLMKSFKGIPLFVLSLFDSLLKEQKIIYKSAELIMTNELIDSGYTYNWSNIQIPYIYEKISMQIINNLLNYEEGLILKYASVIGNLFNIEMIDKINPLNKIIKEEEIEKILLKLNNEGLIELFNDNDDNNENSSNGNIIYKICFPFLREALYQKFTTEGKKPLHLYIALLLSSIKKKYNYFSMEITNKMLRHHLICAQTNIFDELKFNTLISEKNTQQNKKTLNYEYLKILLVKEICTSFLDGNITIGFGKDLEMFKGDKWVEVNYTIDLLSVIYINFSDKNNINSQPDLIIKIKDVYKSNILSKEKILLKNKPKYDPNYNNLKICTRENSLYCKHPRKEKYLFRSKQTEEIYKLEISVNFLRVKLNHEIFYQKYGMGGLPLIKDELLIGKQNHKRTSKFDISSKNNLKEKGKNYKSIDNNNLINKSINCYLNAKKNINKEDILSVFKIMLNNLSLKNKKREDNNNNLFSVEYLNEYISNSFYTPKFLKNCLNHYRYINPIEAKIITQEHIYLNFNKNSNIKNQIKDNEDEDNINENNGNDNNICFYNINNWNEVKWDSNKITDEDDNISSDNQNLIETFTISEGVYYFSNVNNPQNLHKNQKGKMVSFKINSKESSPDKKKMEKKNKPVMHKSSKNLQELISENEKENNQDNDEDNASGKTLSRSFIGENGKILDDLEINDSDEDEKEKKGQSNINILEKIIITQKIEKEITEIEENYDYNDEDFNLNRGKIRKRYVYISHKENLKYIVKNKGK